MNHPELAQPAHRRRARRVSSSPDYISGTRLTVAWTPGHHDGAADLPTVLELIAELDAAPAATWTCSASVNSNWLAALSSARCSEVVLTARLGNDAPAKHLVLELAEFLTIELRASQPLIRVLFLPTVSAHVVRSHA